jgi:DNA polymerase-3 subunit gamma/tau
LASPAKAPDDFSSPGAFSEAFRRRIGAQEAVERAKPEPGAQTGKPPQEKVVEDPPGDLQALRAALIRSLGRDRQILASGIAKTLPWKWEDPGEEKLLIPASDTLTAELLKKERLLIRQITGELWGKALSLEVIEILEENGGLEPELPPQAELVRRMFRGTVVKKSTTEKHDGYQSL